MAQRVWQRLKGPTCYWHFVSWWQWSLGLTVDWMAPNLEIHLPFGFLYIGWVYTRNCVSGGRWEWHPAGKKGIEIRKKDETTSKSSDNVFADLALDGPQDRLVKAELAHQICLAIAARRLTQTRAAEIMGLDQPKVSALMHGKLKGFSVERLFQCLNDLGHEIRISIQPARQGGRRGDTHVIAAAV